MSSFHVVHLFHFSSCLSSSDPLLLLPGSPVLCSLIPMPCKHNVVPYNCHTQVFVSSFSSMLGGFAASTAFFTVGILIIGTPTSLVNDTLNSSDPASLSLHFQVSSRYPDLTESLLVHYWSIQLMLLLHPPGLDTCIKILLVL